MKTRTQIQIKGIVQGVGFRPFVFALAEKNSLKGQVLNNGNGVLIDVEGDGEKIERFINSIRNNPPPLAFIESVTQKTSPNERTFKSLKLLRAKQTVTGSSKFQPTLRLAKIGFRRRRVRGLLQLRKICGDSEVIAIIKKTMKYLKSSPLIALLTFILGVSLVAFWYFRPKADQINSFIAEQQSKNEPNVNESAWEKFLSFENKDLRNLDSQDKDNLQTAIFTLIGKTTDTEFLRLISKVTNEQGRENYLLIGESPLFSIPGNSGLWIKIFNSEGKLINSLSFDTGWRIELKDIKVKYSKAIQRKVIEVGSEPVINGRDVTKQFYALIGKEILLIRLEDSKGNAIQNIYGAPNYIIGLNKTGRSVGEWESALQSEDTAEILSALSWLNGVHWNPSKEQTENFYENINEANLVEKVRASQIVEEKISELLRSENTWLKDAAKLAVKVEYY
jgi:acylphosphatase